MIKYRSVDDVYLHDDLVSDPAIKQGLIERAVSGAEGYEVIPDDNGIMGAYAIGEGGKSIPLGKVDDILLAAGPVRSDAQPEFGTIKGIPQTPFEKIMEQSGIKLNELGNLIDEQAPGTLNSLTGKQIPIIGDLKIRDLLPFVGSEKDGKVSGTPAALIAAGTGQPLGGQPVVGSSVGPDGQTYYGISGSPAMLNQDVGTAVADVATLGLGKPLAKLGKKAIEATKGLPVGLSTKAVGQEMDDLGFYSAASQAVDAIQQPKGTGEQFLAQISKTPGVKPDEIKWTGLDDFLKSKKSVTKQEVQDYMASNRVEIKEVQLGGKQDFDGNRLSELENQYKNLKEHPVDDPSFGEDKYDEMIKLMNIRDQSTTDSLYKSYDEVARKAQIASRNGQTAKASLLWRDAELLNTRAEKLDLEGLGQDKPTKYSKYTLPGGENYREILLTLPPSKSMDTLAREMYGKGYNDLSHYDQGSLRAMNSKNTFSSQHFDEKNVLAHLRVNDRVDADGKKVLMVEEVQSDWHQAGRKKGYQGDYEKDVKEYQSLLKEYGDVKNTDVPLEIRARMEELRPSIMNMHSAPPDAPFKGNWHELAMKRAIQMAAEGGYERIAFTTGKTQAERFDLSKEISRVNYTEAGVLRAFDKDGKLVISQKLDSPDQIEDYIGKEPAKKLMEQEIKGVRVDANENGKPIAYGNPNVFDGRELSGVDLSVGGEGMAGFYDNILPKFLDKYAKKWDAKTGMTKIRLETDAQAVEDAQLLKELGVESDGKSSASVHYIDITPKMRESVVTKGQPMFSIGAGGAGAGAAATQQDQEN